MSKIISRELGRRLLECANFHEALERLHCLSGMECLFLDEFGNETLRAPRKGANAPSRRLWRFSSLAGSLHRQRQALLAGQVPGDAPEIGEIVYALTIEQEVVGYGVLTAYRLRGLQPDGLARLWRQEAGRGQQDAWRSWHQAWLELPVLTTEQVNGWRHCLRMYVREALNRVRHESVMHPSDEPDGLQPLVLAACARIRDGFPSALRLRDLAAELRVSPEHLSREFHRGTGLRFQDYLAEARLEAACGLLESTEERISNVAADCGFSTLSRFNQAFRERRGTTPSRWRRRARQAALATA